MHGNRDDFSDKTKELMARRTGWRCSNPFCRALTCGAGEAVDTAMNVGVAAHICAASPGGGRYDPTMTRETRRHISNGIWLCQTCAKLIDSDVRRYTVTLLHEWKDRAEKEAMLELERSRSKTRRTENPFPERMRELAGAISSCESYEAVMECLCRLQHEMDLLVDRMEGLRDKIELARSNGDSQWEQIYQTQFGHTLSLFERMSSDSQEMHRQAYYLRIRTKELTQNAPGPGLPEYDAPSMSGSGRAFHNLSPVDQVITTQAAELLDWLCESWRYTAALEKAVDESFEARCRYERMAQALLEG